MEDDSSKLCVGCLKQIPLIARFCKFCGKAQPDLEEEIYQQKRKIWIWIIASFYLLDLIICTVVNFVSYFHGLNWLMITEVVLAGLTLIYLGFLWKEIMPLLKWKSFSFPKLLVYSMAAILFAIVVNMSVKWLNKNVFDEDVYFYYAFGHLPFPKLAMLTMVAFSPAIFEELAYRGILLQGLFNILDEKQAVFISAFLFAVVHMSFISFFWLLPFAIWLGNIRWKEQTLWYGIVIHFCFNATACLLEFYQLKLFVIH